MKCGVWFSIPACVLMWIADVCHAGALQRQTSELLDVGAPPNGTALWIARAMRLNGVPMTMKAFSSPANSDEVLHFYERQLRNGSDTKTRLGYEGSERVLAVMATGHYVTIRARNTTHGCEGTIAVSPPLATLKPHKHTTFPRPPTARVVSLQEYEDEGIEAEHISLTSERAPEHEGRAFATQLTRRGWQLLRSEPALDRHGGYVVEAQKATQLAQINLRRDDRSRDTTIVIVWRKT